MALGSTPSQPCKCPLCCLAFVVVSTCSFVPPSVLLPSSFLLVVVEGVVVAFDEASVGADGTWMGV